MPSFDAGSAELLVYTFKSGALSRVAHDLKIGVDRFALELGPDGGELRVEPGSLRVLCAMKGGREDHRALSRGDRAKIEKTLRTEVLDVQRFPRLAFRSTGLRRREQQIEVQGELELHGHRRPLQVQLRGSSAGWKASVRLHQPDFGIKPFSALMGTLKLKPEVLVELRLPGEAF